MIKMGDKEYFALEQVSISKLKELKKSPKHYWSRYLDPEREPELDTDAMIFGRAVHCKLFEESEFDNRFVTVPFVNRRTKDGKEFYEQFIAKNPDKSLLSAENMAKVNKIIKAIKSKKSSQILLNKGNAEHVLLWTDADTGLQCKAKLDYFVEPNEDLPNGLVIDLKTSIADVDVETFSKTIYNFGYHNQMAFYCNAVKQIYGTSDYPTYIYIAVEKTSPYESLFAYGDEAMMECGEIENKRLMQQFKECHASGDWYGYQDEIVQISLPYWAFNKLGNETL